MNRRLVVFAALVAAGGPSLAPAQSLPLLPRSTTTTGLNDSALFMVSDSAHRTRAATGAVLKGFFVPAVVDSATGAARAQVLTTARNLWGLSFNGSANITGRPQFGLAWSSTGRDSLLTGSALVFAANDTILGQPTWNATQTFATGQRTDSATGAARSQTLTTARALWGQSFDGSAAITGSLTSVGDITGGASSMNLLAGTGASRRLVLQTTTSGSAATTALRFNELQQSLHASGTTANPSIAFASDTGTGIYRFGAGELGFAFAGGTTTKWSSTRLQLVQHLHTVGGTAAWPGHSFNGDSTMGMYQYGGSAVGNDTLGFATSANQSFLMTGGATPTLIGSAGGNSMAILAGMTTNQTITLKTTTSAGAAKNTLVLGADSSTTFLGQALHEAGTAALPSVAFTAGTSTGFRLIDNGSSDTLSMSTNGVESLKFTGGASPTIFGGAGNMTLTAGTGNSRTMTLQSTTSAGTAKNTLVLAADTSATFLGKVTTGDTVILSGAAAAIEGNTVGLCLRASRASAANKSVRIFATGSTFQQTMMTIGPAFATDSFQVAIGPQGSEKRPVLAIGSSGQTGLFDLGGDTLAVAAGAVTQMKIAPSGVLRLPLLPAEGSTKNAMCWDGTTFNVTQNAAATCTVSSARFKENIVPLNATAAWGIVGKPQLHSSTYNERNGGRLAIGIVAEQADSADSRLATRDATGLITSTNYEEVTSLLLTVVKDQKARIDVLEAQVKYLMCVESLKNKQAGICIAPVSH